MSEHIQLPIEVQNHEKKQGWFYDSMGEISDGYHTFNELYDFRKAYNALLFNLWAWYHDEYGTGPQPMKSWRHSDGKQCFGGGWFVVSAQTSEGQITNHYEAKDWELFQIDEVEEAPKWDGHTAKEALERLLKLAQGKQG